MNHLVQNRYLICIPIFLVICAFGGIVLVSGFSGSDPAIMKDLNRNGYTISIPSSWTVQEEPDAVSISLPDMSGSVYICTGTGISSVSDSHQSFLEQSIQSAISEFHLGGFSIISEQSGTISDMPAVSTVFTLQDKTGAAIASVLYTMGTNEGVLHLMFTNTVDRYESTVPAFEDLLRTLEITGPSGTFVHEQQPIVTPEITVTAKIPETTPVSTPIPSSSPPASSVIPRETVPALEGELTPVPASTAEENKNANNARMAIADAYEQGNGEKVYSLMSGKSREVHSADMKITGEFGKKNG